MPLKRGSIAAPLAAIVSSLAAASCCLPLGYFAAAGLFGGAGFLGFARPYLIGLSLLALAAGFFRMYARPSCNAQRSGAGIVLLWTAAAFVLAMFLFSQQIAGFLAGIARPSP